VRWKLVVRGVALALVVSSPLWGRVALRPFDFFAVRRVELMGVRFLAPEAVTGALGLRREASVWDRLGPLASRVRGLGGVAEVAVSRRLPGTLRVTVREVEPVAFAVGDEGMIPVGVDGRPLPYDPARVAVDVPVIERPETALVAALAAVRAADPTLFAEIAAARRERGGSVELDLEGRGRIRLGMPVDPAVVRAVAAVERDLVARSQPWRELDGRFAGWVVVRRPSRVEVSS
jgi:cell division septal protein FtsQ